MGVGEGNLQVVKDDVNVILEDCPITVVIQYIIYEYTVQYHSNNTK